MPFSLFLIFSRDIKYHRNYYCISKSKRRKWQNVNYFSFWVSSYYLKDLDFIPVSVLLFESIISHYTMLKIFGPDWTFRPINICITSNEPMRRDSVDCCYFIIVCINIYANTIVCRLNKNLSCELKEIWLMDLWNDYLFSMQWFMELLF